MLRLFANANYDFIAVRRYAYVVTAVLVLPGLLLLLVRGLNYSIEFTGGTLVQVQTKRRWTWPGSAPASTRRGSTARRSRTSGRPTST